MKRLFKSKLAIRKMAEPSSNFKSCLQSLNNLQTNAEAIAQWSAARKLNPYHDPIKPEMQNYLTRLNVDLSKLSVIHVAGTKGKGSTCAFSESMLRSCGFKTGLYISPHLVSVRERIQINGKSISQELFAKHYWECYNGLESTKTKEYPSLPGYFKFLTIMAYKIFLEEKVDVAIIETGVGGRTDATNVIDKPVVTGITSLGYDHMNVLGDTLSEIAFAKAGIFKNGVPGFTVPQTEEAMKELQKEAMTRIGAPARVVQPIIIPEYEKNTLGIDGDHHRINAAMAVTLCKSWIDRHNNPIPVSVDTQQKDDVVINWEDLPPAFKLGLRTTQWPGRSQVIEYPDCNATFYLDGAHTPESMMVCQQWFKRKTEENDSVKILVFNCHPTRDPSTLLFELIKKLRFDVAIFTPNESGRKHILEDKRSEPTVSWQSKVLESWRKMDKDTNTIIAKSIPDLLDTLVQFESEFPDRKKDVLVTGSLYLVGAFLEVLEPSLCDT